MKGQYVIINLQNMDFMKNVETGKIVFYNSEDEALDVCGIYEFENVWIMKLIHNHVEK
jgi:predicted RNA-binding protein with PUA-like domain